jgi:hypothetical protein
MDQETVRGGAYVNLLEDTRIAYRVDPDGDSVEIVAFGPIELSIGMTAEVLRRCQEVLAEASSVLRKAKDGVGED